MVNKAKVPDGLNMFDGANVTLISEVDQKKRCLVHIQDPWLIYMFYLVKFNI